MTNFIFCAERICNAITTSTIPLQCIGVAIEQKRSERMKLPSFQESAALSRKDSLGKNDLKLKQLCPEEFVRKLNSRYESSTHCKYVWVWKSARLVVMQKLHNDIHTRSGIQGPA